MPNGQKWHPQIGCGSLGQLETGGQAIQATYSPSITTMMPHLRPAIQSFVFTPRSVRFIYNSRDSRKSDRNLPGIGLTDSSLRNLFPTCYSYTSSIRTAGEYGDKARAKSCPTCGYSCDVPCAPGVPVSQPKTRDRGLSSATCRDVPYRRSRSE